MLKQCWLTKQSDRGELFSITFESDEPIEEYNRIDIRELTFPRVPTEEHPLRHTIVLSMFTQEDINYLALLFSAHAKL